MFVVAMLGVFVIFAWTMPVVTDFAGRTAVHVSVRVAVQQIARGAGRQIDYRQQGRDQAISKYVQHGDQKNVHRTLSDQPPLYFRRRGCVNANAGHYRLKQWTRASFGAAHSCRILPVTPGCCDTSLALRGPVPDDELRAN